MVDWDAMLANVTLDDTDDAAPEATCEDCIHHNVCGYHITDETDLTVEECTHFKNKAGYAEVKHGRWILGKVEPGYCTPGGNRPWICSECGSVQSWRLDRPTENYCYNCGAKMDG